MGDMEAENTELKRVNGILEDAMLNHYCDENIGIIVEENLQRSLEIHRLQRELKELQQHHETEHHPKEELT